MQNHTSLSLSEVYQLSLSALTAQGFSQEQAAAVARTVTAAERDECYSHGLFRIPFYVKALENPNAKPLAQPIVTTTAASVVHVDAQGGFCPLALEQGVEPLVEKAQQQGIAALAIHNTYNIAALWPEVELLAERGLVALAFTASNASVAPAGGVEPLYGTNPMAFSWPRTGRPPLVFDQASSACARGEIQLHLRDGKPIPLGWAIDKDGQATTDPEAALAGAQLPFGGHKGAAIGLMIELLAGALIGDLFSFESSELDTKGIGAPFGGEFIIAIDPNKTALNGNSEHAQQRAEQLFEKILFQEGTRLPSDRRFIARERTLQQGVRVNSDLLKTLQDYAAAAPKG